jgi:AraC-like DNA-binding protein
MLLCRVPKPSLRPFVKVLWASDETRASVPKSATRELVLPTGMAHLAFRLSDHPLRVFDDANALVPRVMGHAIIGGPRATFYVKDVTEPTRSVGAQLHAGAATLLTGVSANELAGRHTRLDELWGPAAGEARARLLEAQSPERALDVLESLLAERLPKVRGVHPAVAHALGRFSTTNDVGEVVLECGYSHRRFITLFRDAVGLGPKQYCRVLRLQRAIELAAADPDVALAQLAAASGFGDQPHLCRDFRQIAGISPGRYRRIRPAQPNHVPLD